MPEKRSGIQVTGAEWDVMTAIWALEAEGTHQLDALSAGHVIEQARKIRNWNHRTVRTLLSRLVEKNAVRVKVAGSRHFYSSAVAKDACVRVAAKSFASQFFGGDAKSMLLHFVENEELTESDLNEIRSSLNARKRQITRRSIRKSKE